MRSKLVLVGLVAVAACKGQDPQSPGSIAATTAPAGSQTTTSTHSFVSPTETKTYQAQGAVQSYSYNATQRLQYSKDVVLNAAGQPVLDDNGFPTRAVNRDSRRLLSSGQTDQLYAAQASTVRNPQITVAYDPRNAQFTLTINQNGVSTNTAFQDPAHRTDFSGAITPQRGVPNLELTPEWRTKGIQYLQVQNPGSGGDSGISDNSTFFYELPGTTTKYVTYAGYVRNRLEAPIETVVTDTTTTQITDARRRTLLERAAFVFGEQTGTNAVPKTGSASYSGNMIASIVNNPTYERGDPTLFQWMSGTATTRVDFAASTVATSLTGTTFAPMFETNVFAPTANPSNIDMNRQALPAGATFTANATGRIDLVGTGGFTGQFSDATFTAGNTVQKVDIVGSTLDGAFYGPKAEEVGASFRIVGGVPDQRVDIIGSFTGKQ